MRKRGMYTFTLSLFSLFLTSIVTPDIAYALHCAELDSYSDDASSSKSDTPSRVREVIDTYRELSAGSSSKFVEWFLGSDETVYKGQSAGILKLPFTGEPEQLGNIFQEVQRSFDSMLSIYPAKDFDKNSDKRIAQSRASAFRKGLAKFLRTRYITFLKNLGYIEVQEFDFPSATTTADSSPAPGSKDGARGDFNPKREMTRLALANLFGRKIGDLHVVLEVYDPNLKVNIFREGWIPHYSIGSTKGLISDILHSESLKIHPTSKQHAGGGWTLYSKEDGSALQYNWKDIRAVHIRNVVAAQDPKQHVTARIDKMTSDNTSTKGVSALTLRALEVSVVDSLMEITSSLPSDLDQSAYDTKFKANLARIANLVAVDLSSCVNIGSENWRGKENYSPRYVNLIKSLTTHVLFYVPERIQEVSNKANGQSIIKLRGFLSSELGKFFLNQILIDLNEIDVSENKRIHQYLNSKFSLENLQIAAKNLGVDSEQIGEVLQTLILALR